MSVYIKITTLCLLLLVASSCQSDKTAKVLTEKPNILFILLDDMGKEWVSAYGAEDINTPNIDALGKEGIIFNNAYSMPQCTPSRVALMTGQYPWRNGWINHYDVPRWGHGARFDPELNPSYAKILQQEGYKTCATGKWQVNDFRLEPSIMNEVGFDDYCMWTGWEEGNEPSAERYWDPYIHTKEGSKTYKGQFGEDVFADFIIDFMAENKKNPFMVYYAMCLPHGPLVSTPLEPEVKGKMDKHKAMVCYTDFILERLTKALDELGLRENTIIFWTTDNGTSGNITGTYKGREVRGGKTLLTENGINAPFIVNCPGLIPSGVKSEAIIDFTDLFPTFVDLAGGSLPSNHIIDGVSFVDVIKGKQQTTSKKHIQALGSNPAKIIDGRVTNCFKFRDRVLRNEKFKVFVNTSAEIYAIYNVKKDSVEKNNLIDSKLEIVQNALKEFEKTLADLPKTDQNPIYSKGADNEWDIDPTILNKEAEKQMLKINRRD